MKKSDIKEQKRKNKNRQIEILEDKIENKQPSKE